MDKEINFFGRTAIGKEIEASVIQSTEEEWEENKNALLVANKEAGIPSRFWNAKLSDFPTDFTEELRKFVVKKNNDGIFGICGPVGTGKTYTICAGMHERVLSGMNAGLFLSCRTLEPMIMTSRSFKADVSEMDLYNRYAKTPFLVIDEIGKCSNAKLEHDFITTIIALRYDNELPTLFSTNLDFQSLRAFICGPNNESVDVYDRMKSVFIGKALVGDSHRGNND